MLMIAGLPAFWMPVPSNVKPLMRSALPLPPSTWIGPPDQGFFGIEGAVRENRAADARADQGNAAVLDSQGGSAGRDGLVLACAGRDHDRIAVLRGVDGCLHVLLGAGLGRPRGGLGECRQPTARAEQGTEKNQAQLQTAFHSVS